MSAEDELLVDEDATEGQKYRNYRLFNYHRYSDHKEVRLAIKALCEEMGYRGFLAEKQAKVLIMDLYHCYKGDKTRYLQFYLSPNSYEKISRYNHFGISYTVIRKLTEKLFALKYIDFKRGFNDGRTGVKEASKMIAKEKLINFLENDYKVTRSMVRTWKDEDVIILKMATEKKKIDGKIVKIKHKIDYRDDDNTRAMRKVVVAYNELLAKTFIDIDAAGFRYVRKIKEKDKDNKKKQEPLRIDLALKRSKRVFNGDFNLSGRWYGPFWQACPEKLRSRITIDGSHTVEFDFSGLHIHLLYALLGLKLGDKEPYILNKFNDPDKLRKIYKLILLTSVNCNSDHECIVAVEDQLDDEMDEEPDKYPEDKPDLWAMLKELRAHHKPIAKFINKKTGLLLQNIDSAIVEDVIKKMTALKIPVLSIHDSFICLEKDAEQVLLVMKESYASIVTNHIKDEFPDFKLSLEEILTTECRDAESIFQPYRRVTFPKSSKSIPSDQLSALRIRAISNSSTFFNKDDYLGNLLAVKNIQKHTKTAIIPPAVKKLSILKIISWSYSLKNEYVSRYKDYLLSKNADNNHVIKIPAIIEIIENDASKKIT